MASTYEYIDVSALENFTGHDYSTVDAAYTDDVINANITIAERIVNSLCNQTFSGTIPDEVVSATTIMAASLMRRRMIEDGHVDRANPEKKHVPVVTYEIRQILAAQMKGFAYAPTRSGL